jgi:hypothetical protein
MLLALILSFSLLQHTIKGNYMDKIFKVLAILSFAARLGAANAGAQEAVTLEVRGNIKNFTDPARRLYQLTPAQFQALPQSSITTATSWTPVATFSGVKMEDLIQATGAQGSYAQVYALDDYSVRIPVADFRKYGVIIARYMNGQPLPRNGFGPYFIIYPKDKYPKELSTPTAAAKFVWQVNRIEFK